MQMLYTNYKYSYMHTLVVRLVVPNSIQTQADLLFISVIRSCLLHLGQNGAGELMGSGASAHIACAGLAISDDLVD